VLPIDQMILTLSQDMFTTPATWRWRTKLALVLRQVSDDHRDWRLPELNGELSLIARNERRFLGFSEDDSGFDPSHHAGKVVVTTMHKAKGLEWDRVYLMSVNNYDFPSGSPNDRYISERWFVHDSLNLEAETLAQLEAALSTGEYEFYAEGAATQSARLDYVASACGCCTWASRERRRNWLSPGTPAGPGTDSGHPVCGVAGMIRTTSE